MMHEKHKQHLITPAGPMTLCMIGALFLLISLIMLSLPVTVNANSEETDPPGIQYPNMDHSRIDNCAFCHTADGLHLNPYGKDYKAHGLGPQGFMAIEALDSDGDGFTNIEEIRALAQPGSPYSFPPANVRGPAENISLLVKLEQHVSQFLSGNLLAIPEPPNLSLYPAIRWR